MKIAFSALAVTASLALAGAVLAQPQEGGHEGHGGGGMRAACQADLKSLCKDVQPGGGRMMQCLKDHRDAVSAPCKSAIAERMSERRAGHHGEGAAPPSSPN